MRKTLKIFVDAMRLESLIRWILCQTQLMSRIDRFEDLEVWKLTRQLCQTLGTILDAGNFGKNYRLINQVEGSAGSIMDNIAEGFERGSRKEFILFLGYAKGSCGELRSQLYRALDSGYITEEEFNNVCTMCRRISAMLQSLSSYLLKSAIQGLRKKITQTF